MNRAPRVRFRRSLRPLCRRPPPKTIGTVYTEKQREPRQAGGLAFEAGPIYMYTSALGRIFRHVFFELSTGRVTYVECGHSQYRSVHFERFLLYVSSESRSGNGREP